MSEIDFEAEGLVEGLEGEARTARLRLLAELAAEGVALDELRRAVAEDRLVLLPVERALGGGGGRYTAAEVADRAGVPREFLDREWRALGLVTPPGDTAKYTDRDLDAARRLAALREGGLPDDGILEVARVIGMTMSQLAAANRTLIAQAFLREGDNEYDVAVRFAAAAERFAPMMGDWLGYMLNVHLREQLRHDAIAAADLSAGRVTSAQEATIAFVDMVGFTRLGEKLAPEELGAVTGRLAELAAGVVEPPVRLVKLIGDAAMFAAPEPGPVLDGVLELIDRAEGEEFPLLRSGVAQGPVVPRGGDWYGRPVNLASRITAVARPGSVLASAQVRDGLAEGYDWSFAGSRRLKGIAEPVRLYRCRWRGSRRRDADR